MGRRGVRFEQPMWSKMVTGAVKGQQEKTTVMGPAACEYSHWRSEHGCGVGRGETFFVKRGEGWLQIWVRQCWKLLTVPKNSLEFEIYASSTPT